jgi:dienelactone hydrolase
LCAINEGEGTMQKRFSAWNAGWVALCAAAIGCGSGNGDMLGFTGPVAGTIATPPPIATAGIGSTSAAGSVAPPPPPFQFPPAAGSGSTGASVAGASGVGGAAAGAAGSSRSNTAGASGSTAAGAGAGGNAAGAGGSSAGAGGSTSAGPGFIRGPEPTMASALGTAKGPYATMKYTSGFADGPEFGAATIYYPTGDAVAPFSCVAIVPGFTAYQSSIAGWGPFLASHGIIVMTIDTNSTSDDPATRSRALMGALKSCSAENERSASPLMGKVAKDHLGVAGWSMGGGGTLIAASANPTLKAAVSFAAWGPSGGAQNKVPVLMFEATADALAAGMSDSFYSQTPNTTPKMLFEVQGSSHNVANSPTNNSGVIGLYGLSWFKVFLEGDDRYKQFLTAAKPSITTSKFATNVN